MDVLVIGQNPEVLETVKGGLIARGIAAAGTTDPVSAGADFDARDFKLVAFGGGVGSPLRETLKAEFKRQNPEVILLDTFAPVAVPHIAAAFDGHLDRREFAAHFEVYEDNGSYGVSLDLKKACDVQVEVYHAGNGIHGTTVGMGQVSPGPFTLRIDQGEIHDGLNIVLVTLGGREFHIHRLERQPTSRDGEHHDSIGGR